MKEDIQRLKTIKEEIGSKAFAAKDSKEHDHYVEQFYTLDRAIQALQAVSNIYE